MERIKERVEEKEGIPPQQQRLIYSGKQMWVLLHHELSSSVVAAQVFSKPPRALSRVLSHPRNDEKTAADYKIQGGSVLHLVLALRGGSTLHRPCIHLSSSSWVAVVMGPAECQRFRCLSPSNLVSAEIWNPTFPGQRKQNPKKSTNNGNNKKQKRKKGLSDSFVDVFFVNPH